MEFEKVIKFNKAWDRRDPDPENNYGIGAVVIKFTLKGSKGKVIFIVNSGWYLPENNIRSTSVGSGLGYIINGRLSSNMGDLMRSDSIHDTLIRHGSDEMWKELEKYYHEIFGNELKEPNV